ncbi:MAG TPA: MgtC/SapB family protein [Acidimicrobiales bacterium]|nr:MgtC/SapB family protein [Acidimicrobiales bacterium]
MRLRVDQSWFTRVVFSDVALAFVLSYLVGFERELRGSAAGDRTYALVGTGAAAITTVAVSSSPQAIAGIVTGIGFIGAGLVVRGGQGMLRGMTSAATIFAVAAIGIVAGYGREWLAIGVTALVLVDLELRHLPVLRYLDARRYARDDDDMMK